MRQAAYYCCCPLITLVAVVIWYAAKHGSAAQATPTATQVEFHFEIGCPVCLQLLKGTPQAPGVMTTIRQTYGDSIKVRFHPWGNSFFAMPECVSQLGPAATLSSASNPDPRYTPNARYCWDNKCGANVVTKSPDCSTGEMICQHGPQACALQNYAICANKAYGADWGKMLVFLTCLEEGHGTGTQYGWPKGSIEMIVKDCTKKSSLDFAQLDQCATGDEGKQATAAESALTPKHKVVPYVTVNGVVVQGIGLNPQLLLGQIQTVAAPTSRRLMNELERLVV